MPNWPRAPQYTIETMIVCCNGSEYGFSSLLTFILFCSFEPVSHCIAVKWWDFSTEDTRLVSPGTGQIFIGLSISIWFVGIRQNIFSIQSQVWVSCVLTCSVMGSLYNSRIRFTGWVFCVLSDGFLVCFSIQSHRLGFLCARWWVSCTLLHSESQAGFPVSLCFFIQSHRLGFLCAQWWVSCTLLHSESQVGFPKCSAMGFLYSSLFRVTGLGFLRSSCILALKAI